MLKVNVGLSRKLSRDYNSTGFSINVEGEIGVSIDDPEIVVEKVKELYDLAEEALSQQIERYQGESAIATRDEASGHGQNPGPKHEGGNHSQGNGRQHGGHQEKKAFRQNPWVNRWWTI